tara:strand:+ start:365 stop:532 length:168 start_codon:yes stop_codon:yes gene_type:complete
MKGLTEKQKKLPPALQKAILAKQEKDEKKSKGSSSKPKENILSKPIQQTKPKKKY